MWGCDVEALPGLLMAVCGVSGTFLGWAAVVGESPVRENITRVVVAIPE